MNFIHASMPDSDKDLFFGPEEPDDKFVAFAGDVTLADFAVEMGSFPSLKQARKNGWAKPIPPGFSAHKIGKKRFWVLNEF